MPEVQSFKPTYPYQNSQTPVVHYQNNQVFQQPVQSTTQPPKIVPNPNQLFPSPSPIQNANVNSNIRAFTQNSNYHPPSINQMNFNPLNYGIGISNTSISPSFNNSLNLPFNRTQPISTRETNTS